MVRPVTVLRALTTFVLGRAQSALNLLTKRISTTNKKRRRKAVRKIKWIGDIYKDLASQIFRPRELSRLQGCCPIRRIEDSFAMGRRFCKGTDFRALIGG